MLTIVTAPALAVPLGTFELPAYSNDVTAYGWSLGVDTQPQNVSVFTRTYAYSGEEYTASGTSNYDPEDMGMLSLSGGDPHRGTGRQTEVWRTVSVTEGDQIVFEWAFLGGDYLPYNDVGLFYFQGGGEDISNKLSNVFTVGSWGDTGWQKYAFTVPVTDPNARIGFQSKNDRDAGYLSWLLIDDIVNLSVLKPRIATPEPTTLVLGLVGAGIVAFGRGRWSRRPSQ